MSGGPEHYGGGPVPPGAFTPRAPRPGPPPQAALAEFWRRLVALVVDAAIVGVVSIGILGLAGAGFFGDGEAGLTEVLLTLLLLVVLFTGIALIYSPLIMARTDGQTPGKMLTGCRVVRADGRRVTFGWAVLREVLVKGLLLGVAATITGGIAYVVDGIWPFVDGQNRAVHDYVVDSRVVRA